MKRILFIAILGVTLVTLPAKQVQSTNQTVPPKTITPEIGDPVTYPQWVYLPLVVR